MNQTRHRGRIIGEHQGSAGPKARRKKGKGERKRVFLNEQDVRKLEQRARRPGGPAPAVKAILCLRSATRAALSTEQESPKGNFEGKKKDRRTAQKMSYQNRNRTLGPIQLLDQKRLQASAHTKKKKL